MDLFKKVTCEAKLNGHSKGYFNSVHLTVERSNEVQEERICRENINIHPERVKILKREKLSD